MKRRAIVFLTAAVLVLLSAVAKADDISPRWIDEIGLTVSHGTDNDWVNPSESFDLSVKRLTFFGGKYLGEGMRWKLEGELQASSHSANGVFRSIDANEIGTNLIIKREFPSTLPFVPYIGFMAGLSWLRDADDQPKFGDSGWLGKFGPLVGADIALDDGWYLRMEYRLTHTSDPWRSDVGRNFDEFIVGVTYVF